MNLEDEVVLLLRSIASRIITADDVAGYLRQSEHMRSLYVEAGAENSPQYQALTERIALYQRTLQDEAPCPTTPTP